MSTIVRLGSENGYLSPSHGGNTGSNPVGDASRNKTFYPTPRMFPKSFPGRSRGMTSAGAAGLVIKNPAPPGLFAATEI
jgi:hypothetical protein